MKPQAIRQADYLDILFDNRNKAYGAYALRRQHGKRMNQALLLLLGLCITILGSSMLPDKQPAIQAATPFTEREVDLTKVNIEPVKPPTPQPPAPEPPAPSKPMVKNTPPKVVPDETPDITLPPDVDSLAGKLSGPTNSDGDVNGNITSKPSDTKGTGTTPVTPPPAEPFSFSEVMPTFKGNIYKYLGNNIRYPSMAKEQNITGKVIVRFVVNEDGGISNVTLVRGIGGGCNDEAMRVIRNMPNWNPGMQNGKAVKVYFTLPINFQLQ